MESFNEDGDGRPNGALRMYEVEKNLRWSLHCKSKMEGDENNRGLWRRGLRGRNWLRSLIG